MALPFEVLASPEFAALVSATSGAIQRAGSLAERFAAPARPAQARPQPSVPESAELDALIGACLRLSRATNSVAAVRAAPGARVRLSAADCARYPSRIRPAQLAQMSREQREGWAAGTIQAAARGRRAFEDSLRLVRPEDAAPPGAAAYARCRRAVRVRRQRLGIPAVDALAGRVRGKAASVLGGAAAAGRGREQQWLAEYRQVLKDVLRDYNVEFERRFGREPLKEDKEALRALYTEYKALKQFIAEEKPAPAQVADPQLRQLIAALAEMRAGASQMLRRMVPRDQEGLRGFKRDVQRCLHAYKEQYDRCLAAVQAARRQTGAQPPGLAEGWAQGYAETYNLLFAAYEQLKAQVK